MYDFDCPYCSWGMNRDDINDQVHEDNHVGEWDIECNNCKKTFELKATDPNDALSELDEEQSHDS